MPGAAGSIPTRAKSRDAEQRRELVAGKSGSDPPARLRLCWAPLGSRTGDSGTASRPCAAAGTSGAKSLHRALSACRAPWGRAMRTCGVVPARSHQLLPRLCSLLPRDQLEALSEPGHRHGVISSQRRGEADLHPPAVTPCCWAAPANPENPEKKPERPEGRQGDGAPPQSGQAGLGGGCYSPGECRCYFSHAKLAVCRL